MLPEVPRRRGRRLLLIGVVLLLLVGAGAVAANLLLAKPALQTYTVQRGEIRSTVETNGKLEALTTADLAFKNGGRLVHILVHEGDQVAAGTALAELDTD